MTLWRERIRSPSVGSGCVAVEHRESAEELGAHERVSEIAFADVVLVEQDQDVVSACYEERPDRAEEVDHPCSPELAQRVAQPDVTLTPGE